MKLCAGVLPPKKCRIREWCRSLLLTRLHGGQRLMQTTAVAFPQKKCTLTPKVCPLPLSAKNLVLQERQKSGFTHTYQAHFLTQTWALRDTPTRPHNFLTHTWTLFSGDWARSGTLWRSGTSLVKPKYIYIYIYIYIYSGSRVAKFKKFFPLTRQLPDRGGLPWYYSTFVPKWGT